MPNLGRRVFPNNVPHNKKYSGEKFLHAVLERDAAILVNATDAFTTDHNESRRLGIETPYLVVPLLVTNAALCTARYEPATVSLDSGEFDQLPDDIQPVRWMRFGKTIMAGRGRDLGQRTIFVVNASEYHRVKRWPRRPCR